MGLRHPLNAADLYVSLAVNKGNLQHVVGQNPV
jgi:hypothetical protein